LTTDAFLNQELFFPAPGTVLREQRFSGVHWTTHMAIDSAQQNEAGLIGRLQAERVMLPSSDPARDLNNQSQFGTILSGGRVQLSLLEAAYLEEKKKITVVDARGRKLDHDKIIAVGKKSDKTFWTKYMVYRDLRSRGYIVKTALKFGADFRVYDRGVKPGEDHAKWVVFAVHEAQSLTWHEWSAKNRVAHSTKKRLLIAVVDDEGEVSYWEARWLRP
jgi:tRNA-intron endonuclease, archaea type